MANYNLVAQGSYNPFTYDELLKPVAAYTQEYNTQQEALSNLATMANVWKNKANEQTDSRTYAQYKKYSDDLKAQVDSLASRGISTTSRQALMDLKARYGDEIKSIEDAYNRRAKLAEEQRKGKAAGLIYDYDADTTSLDKFVFDNQKDYDTIDLNKVYAKATADFGAISKSLENYGKGRPIDAYTNTFIQNHGITREMAASFVNAVNTGNIDKFIKDNPIVGNLLYNTLNSNYNASGVSNWNNKEADSKVRNTILEAVNNAVGQTQVSPMTNQAAVFAHQDTASTIKEDIRHQHAMDEIAAKHGDNVPNTPLVPGQSRENLAKTPKRGGKGNNMYGREDALDALNAIVAGRGNGREGRGLSANYAGKNTKGQIVNPLKVYETFANYMQGKPNSAENIKEARARVAKLYNNPNLKILTESQYHALQNVGYSRNSKIEEFQGTNAINRVYSNYEETVTPMKLNTTNKEQMKNDVSSYASKKDKVLFINNDGKITKDKLNTTGLSVYDAEISRDIAGMIRYSTNKGDILVPIEFINGSFAPEVIRLWGTKHDDPLDWRKGNEGYFNDIYATSKQKDAELEKLGVSIRDHYDTMHSQKKPVTKNDVNEWQSSYIEE